MIFFYWALSGQAFDADTMAVVDEDILTLDIEHTEGQFPTATILVRNPKAPLLSPNRRQWVWISTDRNGPVESLFYGRLIGIPDDIFGQACTFKFVAQPPNYATLKHHVAQGLKVRPFYDPVFMDVNRRDDPDAILEAYPYLWHVARDLEVSVSNVIEGEDGLIVIAASEIPEGTVQVHIGQAPITSITIDGSVTWANASSFFLDMGTSTHLTMSIGNLTGAWPQPGAMLGSGWSVKYASVSDNNGANDASSFTHNIHWENKAKLHDYGDTMNYNISQSVIMGPIAMQILTFQKVIIANISENPDHHDINPATGRYNWMMVVGPQSVTTSLILRGDAGADHTEHIRFTLTADLQPIITAPDDVVPLPEVIEVQGSDVGLPVQGFDQLTGLAYVIEGPPIVDPQRPAYFPTDRGLWSFEYLISLARAKIVYSSRAVTITCRVSFSKAMEFSCRKSAQIYDPRIPKGSAFGKIIAYKLHAEGGQPGGQEGIFYGEVTIGCCVGRDGHAALGDGEPTYVEEGYVDPGYQTVTGDQLPGSAIGDIAYSIPSNPTNDAGMSFPPTKDQVVLVEAWRNTYQSELTALMPTISAMANAAAVSQAEPANDDIGKQFAAQAAAKYVQRVQALIPDDSAVYYDLQLRPIDKIGLEATFLPDVSQLALQRQIDLEDSAGPLSPGGPPVDPGESGGGGSGTGPAPSAGTIISVDEA